MRRLLKPIKIQDLIAFSTSPKAFGLVKFRKLGGGGTMLFT